MDTQGNQRAVGPMRSQERFSDPNFYGMMLRAATKSMGFSDADMRRPVIGIAQTWSELNHCNSHLREVADWVKRGVWQAGGMPLEFPTISLGEFAMRPNTMFYRNLMAMDTEEMIRAHPIDGVVLLGNCDKTVPAQLMGAASADVPALVVTGGPALTGSYRGQTLGACTDCRRLWSEYRSGTISRHDIAEVEDELFPSHGSCTVMGTASTMACLAEALGMALPGSAAIPAPDARRLRMAEQAGITMVDAALKGRRPSAIMTRAAFENAIRVLMAIGGSTNGVIHLTAIAGRLGIDLDLGMFDAISKSTPMLVNLKPSGAFQMPEFFRAGGVPAVMHEIRGLLRETATTMAGRTIGEIAEQGESQDRTVISPFDTPLQPEGGTAVLRGNIAPRGCVIKQSAASPRFQKHQGRAVVFHSVADLNARIDAPDLDVDEECVLVLLNSGPVGGPGMPESGFLPIPKKLLERGVRDMVRISDARMSGTAYGTVVLHITPEAAIGGPLAAVRDGDLIDLNVEARSLHLLISDDELLRRLGEWTPPRQSYARGYWRLYEQHVLQADQGCDFDFLRAVPEHTAGGTMRVAQ